MAITFRFVNRLELYNQAKLVIDKIENRLIEYNLYGYWGAPGIGKTAILDAIYSYLKESKIETKINYKKYDCKSDNIDSIIDSLKQESSVCGIAIIDHLEEIQTEKLYEFQKACETFVNRMLPGKVIFCASKAPDRISKLLRLEQRLIIQLNAMEPNDTIGMINQIFPKMISNDKSFLIEYAVGYPQIISIFCCILQGKQKKEKTIEIKDKKSFLWKALIELIMSIRPDMKSSEEIERFLWRLFFLSLFEGFMPESGRQLLNFISSKMNSIYLKFDSSLDFQDFIQTSINYSILAWAKNDYILYRPLQNLLRKYLSDFEREKYLITYQWLVNQYNKKYANTKGKEKGHILLKLAFYKHQIKNFTKETIIDYLLKEIAKLEKEKNFDAIEVINQEIKNSEIGNIFNINNISEIRK